MKLFAGLDRTDYQDIFRAIGAMLDDQQFVDVRLWEHEDGVIIQGRQNTGAGLGRYQTYLLSDDDLRDLLNEAYSRRGMIGRRILSTP